MHEAVWKIRSTRSHVFKPQVAGSCMEQSPRRRPDIAITIRQKGTSAREGASMNTASSTSLQLAGGARFQGLEAYGFHVFSYFGVRCWSLRHRKAYT